MMHSLADACVLATTQLGFALDPAQTSRQGMKHNSAKKVSQKKKKKKKICRVEMLPSVCRSNNVQEALNTAVMLVDVSYPKWRILFCSGQFDKATGLSGSDVAGQHVWDHFVVVGKSEVCPSSHTLLVWQIPCLMQSHVTCMRIGSSGGLKMQPVT